MQRDKLGCLHDSETANWNQKGVFCGECTHKGLECPKRNLTFIGINKEGRMMFDYVEDKRK